MAEWLVPDWAAPTGVRALCTTRVGGVSKGPWGDFNLADHVQDDANAVGENRRRLLSACEGLERIQWLTQIHSPQCVSADGHSLPEADASITDQAGLACAVLTADCLPVLFCDSAGEQVAAAHAGWRGLLDGVLINPVRAFHAAPDTFQAWLGPCIRQARFEVGPEVRAAFLERFQGPDEPAIKGCFVPASEPGKFLCDLAGLAALQLCALGLSAITDSGLCSYDDSLFYSYRRQNPCGRFASLIYRLP